MDTPASLTLTRYFLTGQGSHILRVTSHIMMLGRYTIVDTAHILVVDDEEAIREVVSTMLESRGYHCTTLSNGRAAQEFVRKQTPDLVLSDMIMPEMDGIQTTREIKRISPRSQVVVLGHPEAEADDAEHLAAAEM